MGSVRSVEGDGIGWAREGLASSDALQVVIRQADLPHQVALQPCLEHLITMHWDGDSTVALTV